jgi:hypothetical protein
LLSDLPLTNDQNFCVALAYYLLTNFKDAFLEISEVACDWKARLNGVDLLSLEIMDTVSISDTQLNMTSIVHAITAILLRHRAGWHRLRRQCDLHHRTA